MPYIKDCLESIAIQLSDQLCGDFEVLISDNASTDDSAKVIREYAQKFPQFFYVNTNPQNIGYDGNILRLVEIAKGEFLWFLGCQEQLMPTALDQLIPFLAVNRLDYLQLGFEIKTEGAEGENKQNFVTTPIIFESALSLLEALHGPGMALSTNIIRRAAWNFSAKKLKSSGWAHIEGIFDLILADDFRHGAFFPGPLFYLFRESNGWWETPAVYGNFLSYLKLFKQIMPNTPNLNFWHKKRLLNLCGEPLRHSIALGKQKGYSFNLNNLRHLISIIGCHPLLLISALHLALLSKTKFATDEQVGQRLRPSFIRKGVERIIRFSKTL